MEDLDFDFDFDFDFGEENNQRIFTPREYSYISDRGVKYRHAEKMAKEIGLIKKGERRFCIIDGSFIFGDFIEAWIVENRIKVKELTISTLSMSDENIDSLANLIHCDDVEELNLIVSDYFYSHERHNLIPYIYQELDIKNNFQLAVAGVHTKICLISDRNGNFWTIHGSANLRTSKNIEQFVIENDEDLFKFNHEWHHNIIEKYKTINKSIRYKKLWQTIKETQVQETNGMPSTMQEKQKKKGKESKQKQKKEEKNGLKKEDFKAF